MPFNGQKVLPALRDLKYFERLLKSDFEYIVLLETRISNLKSLVDTAHRSKKKVLVHADLVQGLKPDEYGAEYLCNDVKPEGIISTRSNIIIKAKTKGILAIQRTFLLDTMALEKTYPLIERTKPDFIEIIPGIIPDLIKEVRERLDTRIISGGFIRNPEQVNDALNAGAEAITTSDAELWKQYL